MRESRFVNICTGLCSRCAYGEIHGVQANDTNTAFFWCFKQGHHYGHNTICADYERGKVCVYDKRGRVVERI